MKDSYQALAQELGSLFATAVNDGKKCQAIDPTSIPEGQRDDFCHGVIKYQLQRVEQILETEDDEVIRSELAGIGPPAAVFAPYFYVDESWADAGLEVAIDLIKRSVALKRLLKSSGRRHLATGTDLKSGDNECKAEK